MTIETPDTATPSQKYRTDYTEADDGFWSGVGTVVDQVNLSYGEDIAEESRDKEFRKFKDWDDNEKFYEAYGDTTAWYLHESTEERRRSEIEAHIESGRYSLDESGEVIDSNGELDTWLYDRDAIKGALLAKQNGWNATKAKTAYRELGKAKGKDIQERMESQDIGLGQLAVGMLAGHGAQAETFFEVAASPARIMGQTIAKGAMKAFAIEGGIIALGEMGREYRIAKHKELMGEEYGLWDSAKNVMFAAGLGGVFRATGSALVDYKTVQAIKGRGAGSISKELEKKGIPVEEAKLQQEIVERFFRREMYMLTGNTTKHIDMMHKAERDIDNGKPVDVANHTELSVDDKVKELGDNIDDIPENSLEVEVKNTPEMQKVDLETKEVEKTIDEAQPFRPLSKDDPFEGSATKQDGEVRIEEAGNKAEYDEVQAKIDALEKPLSERQQQMKEAAVPKIGGSEEEAKQAVKQMFKKTDDQYKGMSQADIAEQDRMYKADLDMETNAVFAKFGDNLAAGAIAGVEEDEQGNLSFNPEMFVAGLGGYTALKAMAKSKTLRKEIGDSLTRKFNDLDDNPLFNALVGKQQVIDGRFKSDGLSKLAQKQADEMGLTPEDIADFDADDFQYMNKAARMIDNMDIQAKEDAIPDLPYEARPTEDIAKEIEEWSPAQTKESIYKEGDVVRAEYDPTVTPYARAVQKKIQPEIDKTTRDANFKEWFSDSKVVDEDGEPLVVYHGTTHDFTEFTMDRANPENHHGSGFYFSNSLDDVNRNYGTTEGADLTSRIDQRAEQLASELDLEYDDPKVIAMAREELMGEAPSVMPVYVKLKKPAEIGGDNPEWLELKRYDDDGEWLDEPEGDGAELFDALLEAIESNAYDSENAYQIIEEVQEELGDEFTLKQFEDVLRGNEEFGYLEDDMGRLINHEIIGDSYSNAGYDGIILHNAEEQFSNMGMNPDTTHYVVFQPKDIKSVNNKGAFSEDGNILKGALTVPAIGIAASQKEDN